MSIPRLIDYLPQDYSSLIRNHALSSNYWTFSLEHISKEQASEYCKSSPDIVVSHCWGLVGLFQDIVLLAKLTGMKYSPQGRESCLPGFNPEETYWIKTLKLMKLCPPAKI